MRFDDSGRLELFPRTEPLRLVLPHRLALALETEHPSAFEELQAHDRAMGNRLYAAALRDILGLAVGDIAEVCGYAEERTARRNVSRARGLWHRMAGWPWWYFGPGGQPTEGWRDHGGGPRLDAALATWATGELRLSEWVP